MLHTLCGYRKHFLRTVANVADLLDANRCCRMPHKTPSLRCYHFRFAARK